jgi:hypothetical protein
MRQRNLLYAKLAKSSQKDNLLGFLLTLESVFTLNFDLKDHRTGCVVDESTAFSTGEDLRFNAHVRASGDNPGHPLDNFREFFASMLSSLTLHRNEAFDGNVTLYYLKALKSKIDELEKSLTTTSDFFTTNNKEDDKKDLASLKEIYGCLLRLVARAADFGLSFVSEALAEPEMRAFRNALDDAIREKHKEFLDLLNNGDNRELYLKDPNNVPQIRKLGEIVDGLEKIYPIVLRNGDWQQAELSQDARNFAEQLFKQSKQNTDHPDKLPLPPQLQRLIVRLEDIVNYIREENTQSSNSQQTAGNRQLLVK